MAHWKSKTYKHGVRMMHYNATAISYVNNKRGIKSEFCIDIEQKVLCVHIRSSEFLWHTSEKHKTEADWLSREFNKATEGNLQPQLFEKKIWIIWNDNNRSFCISHKSPNWEVHFMETRPWSHSNRHIFSEMEYWVLLYLFSF